MNRFQAIRTRETALGDLVITLDWGGGLATSTVICEPRGPVEVLGAFRRLCKSILGEVEKMTTESNDHANDFEQDVKAPEKKEYNHNDFKQIHRELEDVLAKFGIQCTEFELKIIEGIVRKSTTKSEYT